MDYVPRAVLDRARWQAERRRLDRMLREVRAGLAEVTSMGGVPKDLGLGLVDFPHVRDGRTVSLCWRVGEVEIRWWHGLDEGYAGRKPL